MPENPVNFSVVIATYNRPDQLGNCLAALARQEYPREQFEVIVVDDGGVQDLSKVCARYANDLEIALVRKENGGPASARNMGVAQAGGTYIAFTDDDCEPAPGWLAGLEHRLAASPDAMVGGHTVNKLNKNLFSQASQIIIDMVYQHYNSDPDNACFLASNNMAMPRNGFNSIGGFDLDFYAGAAEDRELCARWLQAGFRIIYDDSTVVYHSHHLGFVSFFKQHFRYGRGAWSFHRRFRNDEQWKLSQDASWHLKVSNWLPYPYRTEQEKPTRLMLALVYWQLANALGFGWQGLRGLFNRSS